MPGRGRAGQGGRGTLGLHGLTLGGGPSSGCPLPASQPPVCGLPESREHCTVACSAPELTGWGASLRSAQGPHKVRTQGPPHGWGRAQRWGCGPAHCTLLVGLPGLVPALLLPPSCRPELCPRRSQARLPPVLCRNQNSKTSRAGSSPAIWYFGLYTFTAKGMGSVPGGETKILQATRHRQK